MALQYREAHWPRQRTAPYQVLLDADHALIYVPQDDDAYCRQATPEDVRIALRADALAVLPQQASEPETIEDTGSSRDGAETTRLRLPNCDLGAARAATAVFCASAGRPPR